MNSLLRSLTRRYPWRNKQATLFPVLFSCLSLLSGCASLASPGESTSPIVSFEPKKPVQVALVLGGGGSRGLAHLGAIKELEAAGIRPDLIIGCSAGAIIGAFYADDPDITKIEKTLLQLKRSDIVDTTFFSSRFGFVEGKILQAFMQKHLRSQTFEELQIPLIIMATDLSSGSAVELSHGEIAPCVRASCALPGIFKPVLLQDRHLVDGGVSNPMPVTIAKKYGAKVIIAVDLGEKLPNSKPYHLFGIAKRGLEIHHQKFVEQSLGLADIAIKMEFEDIGMFTDHLNEQIYEHGRTKMRAMLAEIQKKIADSLSLGSRLVALGKKIFPWFGIYDPCLLFNQSSSKIEPAIPD